MISGEPIHPGQHLAEFLAEYEISQYRAARDMDVPPRRINEIVHGKRRISADTALRLARYFRTTARFWMNLQTQYDLACAERVQGREIEENVRPIAA